MFRKSNSRNTPPTRFLEGLRFFPDHFGVFEQHLNQVSTTGDKSISLADSWKTGNRFASKGLSPMLQLVKNISRMSESSLKLSTGTNNVLLAKNIYKFPD